MVCDEEMNFLYFVCSAQMKIYIGKTAHSIENHQ